MYTIEQAKQWVQEHYAECMESYQECSEIPVFMKVPESPLEDIWLAGCWLNDTLQKAGATDEQIAEIGFVHGQRSFGGNTYKWAVKYVNEFLTTKNVIDKPGKELAEKIFSETIKIEI